MTHRPNIVCARQAGRRSRGFTLVEMLIVLGIALLLMAIVLPAVNRAYNQGVRTRMAADLQAIVTALEAYRQDHGDIPRTDAANKGATVLCQALLAPGDQAADGKDGLGFRTRKAIGSTPQGKAYGPYLDPDKFKLDTNATSPKILDINGRPILYFPGHKTADVTATNGYVATAGYGPATSRPMFNASDNDTKLFDEHDTASPTAADGLTKFQYIMGCNPATGGASGINPATNGPYAPAYTGAYLLWSAGPDEKFGLPKVAVPSSNNKCDDVANFDRSTY